MEPWLQTSSCAPGPFPVPSKQLNPVGPGHGRPIPPLLQESTPHLSLYDLILTPVSSVRQSGQGAE